LFLPPALATIQESNPLEKVILARDEMTNMVWGIEERIAGILGNGIDGFEAATALSNFFLHGAPPGAVPPRANDAKIRYVLGTAVPENWIPFISRHNPGSNRQIRLQRAAMPRLTDAIPDSRVEPRGSILRTGLDKEGDREAYSCTKRRCRGRELSLSVRSNPRAGLMEESTRGSAGGKKQVEAKARADYYSIRLYR
jgi:hypothetical protein